MSKYTQHAIVQQTAIDKMFDFFKSDRNFTIACIVIGIVGLVASSF